MKAERASVASLIMSRTSEVDQAKYASEQRKPLPPAKSRQLLDKFHSAREQFQPFLFNLSAQPADIYTLRWKE